MSLECAECERDARGGHLEDCVTGLKAEIKQLKKENESAVIEIMQRVCEHESNTADKEDAFNLIYDDLYKIVESVLTK